MIDLMHRLNRSREANHAGPAAEKPTTLTPGRIPTPLVQQRRGRLPGSAEEKPPLPGSAEEKPPSLVPQQGSRPRWFRSGEAAPLESKSRYGCSI
ncbi:hypothetical protein Acsp05_28920 [Actinokineospora sp. NBRC 105648]|nr:hypothetical protein Acsp05_28920 [Actinokineospora sp. NBRC 105648]